MFQSFSVNSDASKSRARIEELRLLMQQKNINAYMVPLCDEHQGEYIAPYAQRLQWLTGFTGSAGLALILEDKAVFFTDGRYQLQVREQTDPKLFIYEDSTICSPINWLQKNGANLAVAIDPWLHTIQQVEQLKKTLAAQDGKLVCLAENLIDILWQDQPARPSASIVEHATEYSGKAASQKIATLQALLTKKQQKNFILTDTTSIAWLFNIRGKDVEHNPIVLSFACIDAQDKPRLFIASEKIPPAVVDYLEPICGISESSDFITELAKMASSGASFTLDPQSCCEKIYATIIENGGQVTLSSDPVKYAKALKNSVEIAGARRAHIRDGVALTRFLAWLDQQKTQEITEIETAKKLEELRIETAKAFNTELKDISFDTISGAGAHGAIIHYRVTEETNSNLKDGELYLIDSGAQYLDGTTDVTRTIARGTIGPEERRCFTLVLKGMINLTNACFPEGTKGLHLDILARYYLLQHGLDYAHGTGHGVGSYLSVHEGPQSISRLSEQPLQAGMIISNEPGYYKAGAFGIRIENLLLVKKKDKTPQAEIDSLHFETLTLCPIERKLVDKNMLSTAELEWLNNYHKTVYTALAPYLDAKESAWLSEATKEL